MPELNLKSLAHVFACLWHVHTNHDELVEANVCVGRGQQQEEEGERPIAKVCKQTNKKFPLIFVFVTHLQDDQKLRSS